MKNIEIGHKTKQIEGYETFVLNPFPPKEGFNFDMEILKKSDTASRLIGKLDGITKLLPDLDFFLLMYLRKDAASSSQIEGTAATMIDAIEAEIDSDTKLPTDVDDILHYIKALNYGIKRVTSNNFPKSLRFVRELHKVLMQKARKTHFSNPGEFRKSQNWIGGTNPVNAKFVPPTVNDMSIALDYLEKFIHAGDYIPTIIKAGLIHAQFETIHPFLDGNGRTGRLLTTFYLWKEGYLEKPVLFLSSYFKKHQETYYSKLSGYHNGNIGNWTNFFLDGVIEISKQSINIADKITVLREKDMDKIRSLGKRTAESVMKVLPMLYRQPIVTTGTVQNWTGFSRQGALSLIGKLKRMGILKLKDKKQKYNQKYVYKEYLDIFEEEK